MLLTVVRKIVTLLDRGQKWQLLIVFLIILLTAIVEVAGVASVMPFLALAADPELAFENEYLARLYALGGFSSQRSFLVVVGLTVLGLLTSSNALAAFASWRIATFGGDLQHALSERLLRTYLHQSYAFALRRNTAVLSTNVLVEVQGVVGTVIVPLLQIFARGIVALLMIVLLLSVAPVLALAMAIIFGLVYFGLSMGVKAQQVTNGELRKKANDARFKAGFEALSAFKEIKISGTENNFLARFSKPSRRVNRLLAKESILGEIPRYVIDTVAFGVVIATIVALLLLNYELSGILPFLGLYVVTGYRLLPAFQKIYQSVAKLRFGRFAFDELYMDLLRERPHEVLPAAAPDALPFRQSIALENVWFRHEGSDWILRDISLFIPKNTSVAFVGTTGAGKSTLVDIILGLLQPQEGKLLIDGKVLRPEEIPLWQAKIGYVPQQIFLLDGTIASNIAFGIPEEEVDAGRLRKAAEAARLDDFIGSLPEGYETTVGDRGVRLSGGQRQRIGIARALYHDPEILVLDEATSALDNTTERAVMDAIKTFGGRKTLIIIAHRLTTVMHCDRLYLIDSGEVRASGSYAELIAVSEEFRHMAEAS